jgi:SAM-dependent methyltransferase
MSRKYMIDRWCVRCGRTEPSPFTKRCLAKIMTHYALKGEPTFDKLVVDVGCGNGRNSKRFLECGFKVRAFDMNSDCEGVEKIVLGMDKIPIETDAADIVLANYSLMFLNDKERFNVMYDISRILKKSGMFIWELYPAKDSFCKNSMELKKIQEETAYRAERAMSLKKVFSTKDKGFYSGVEI